MLKIDFYLDIKAFKRRLKLAIKSLVLAINSPYIYLRFYLFNLIGFFFFFLYQVRTYIKITIHRTNEEWSSRYLI